MRSIGTIPFASSRIHSAARLERDRHSFAVTVVAQFLKAFGRTDLAGQFRELGSALSDLNSGITRPFLVVHDGTRADGSNEWRARAFVAAAVDALRRADLERKEIAKKIRDEYPELATLVQSGKDLGESAISWWGSISQGRSKEF